MIPVFLDEDGVLKHFGVCLIIYDGWNSLDVEGFLVEQAKLVNIPK